MCLSILFEFFCKSYSGFSILSTSTSRSDSAPVATKEEVIKYLEENEIFKDVVPYFEPKVQLRARFLASGEEANFGNIIYPSEAQTRPVIDILPFPGEERIPEDIAGRVAYIVGTDPDAPTRENVRSSLILMILLLSNLTTWKHCLYSLFMANFVIGSLKLLYQNQKQGAAAVTKPSRGSSWSG